jgi:NADPH:quinone reductase-like Zn-dependent oxidoreductase
MILEEIEGSVRIMYAGKVLSVGDSADDYSKGVFVFGAGKAIFRVDPNSTFEIKGVEAEAHVEPAPIPAPAPAPAPIVEAAPVAERVTPAMETPGEDTKA